MTAIYVRPTTYDVSVWPDNIDCIDSHTWRLEVAYRGHGQWAVTNGGRTCMDTSGTLDWESIPSERTDEWLATHRFSLDDALALARRHAPDVTVNGMTATEVLARHQARHPDGNCDPRRPA